MLLSVLDVAKYILERMGTITTMKLQKLVYYSQAWSLVWDEEPLFGDPIEAWIDGPVVETLYKAHRGKFKISVADLPEGDSDQLTKDQRDTIDCVIDSYGRLTGAQLSALSHDEGPWSDARGGCSPTRRTRTTIDLDSIARFYTALYNDKNES